VSNLLATAPRKRPVAAIASALVVAALLGAAAAILPIWFIAAALFIPVFVVLAWARPVYGLAVVIGLVSELIHPAFLPRLPFMGGTVHAADLALAAMALIVLARAQLTAPAGRSAGMLGSLASPLVLLVVVVIASAAYAAVVLRVNPKDVLGETRDFIYLALVPLTVMSVRTPKDLDRLLLALAAVGVLFAVGQTVQAFTGIKIFGGSARLEYLSTLGDTSWGVYRSLTHGINLMILALLLLVGGRATGIVSLPVMVTGTAVLLAGLATTYGRTTWTTTLAACLAFAPFLGLRGSLRAVPPAVATLAVLVAVVAVARPQMVEAAWDRAASVMAELQRGQSISWRRYEADVVLPQIERSPVLGLGMGSAYRSRAASDALPDQVRYIHNSYLYVAAKMGLLGLLAWAYLLVRFAALCRGAYRRSESAWHRLAVAALGIGVGRMALAGITEPWLMLDAGIAFFAMACGAVLVIEGFQQAGARRAGGGAAQAPGDAERRRVGDPIRA
jgi:O-antigen ligase